MTTSLTGEDRELLDHYVAMGAEAWNGSVEAAWLDYEIRAWIARRLPARRPLVACNVGIGCGLFDDWLGRELGAGAILVSVDRDAACCRLLAMRQARERHPHPSEVVCGDVLDGALDGRAFDVITCIGSTLGESGSSRALERTLRRALAPDGSLLVAEVHQLFGGMQLAMRELTR